MEAMVAPGDGDGDYWKLEGATLSRVHVKLRSCLFDPRSVHDIPVEVGRLCKTRKTICMCTDGSFAQHDTPDWSHKAAASQLTKMAWRGVTYFEIDPTVTLAATLQESMPFPLLSFDQVGHRTRNPEEGLPINVCVARPVNKREAAADPRAQAALKKEWDRLRAIGCWNEDGVKEWGTLAREARSTGETIHVGRIFAICHEKNAELNEGDPRRKFKGRVVFQGNNVRDQNWEVAMFQELSSCPATMDAAKTADCYGVAHGNSVQQADAEQAYTQSKLGGVATWIRLPDDQRPASWAGLHDPVCPLVLALYGHPDAGGYWERHCEKHLLAIGFKPIPEWRSCFWHADKRCLLVVYVDDFKLAGPAENIAPMWEAIRRGVKIGDPEDVGLYLGCKHILRSATLIEGGAPVTVMEYDMQEFLTSCVALYSELAGNPKLKNVPTPFLADPITDMSQSPDGYDSYPAMPVVATRGVSAGDAGADPDRGLFSLLLHVC